MQMIILLIINDNIELKYYANLILKIQNIPDDCW